MKTDYSSRQRSVACENKNKKIYYDNAGTGTEFSFFGKSEMRIEKSRFRRTVKKDGNLLKQHKI
jgi:hypothetical protein